uniref:NYN domain-containing protein n=1 Tax=Chromera velia CCMP2878 TaxID=1169474 RepID=A0A0G4GWM0_9ALVE|eukprot:Cvel_23701.t1-p1 / transcript=Cvel_23701.t1 / gene=Cvel_23701 / organism=Chromera_velia_CCMP2878 / gene_product=hypothetical protein / transcript_product=hypothetical protein / location=Cvel_scaffold2474:2096-3640(-) / protein_length=152 / sequence_SO=supercontig / SO=protein_coding / is_pseudo=false
MDFGVMFVSSGNKKEAVDKTIKDMIDNVLQLLSDTPRELLKDTYVVIVSSDRDFSSDHRKLRAAGIQTVALDTPQTRDSYLQNTTVSSKEMLECVQQSTITPKESPTTSESTSAIVTTSHLECAPIRSAPQIGNLGNDIPSPTSLFFSSLQL